MGKIIVCQSVQKTAGICVIFYPLYKTIHAPNSHEQMSFDTWCWTLFNPSADVLEQRVIALEELCKEDGYMRVERVPLETV